MSNDQDLPMAEAEVTDQADQVEADAPDQVDAADILPSGTFQVEEVDETEAAADAEAAEPAAVEETAGDEPTPDATADEVAAGDETREADEADEAAAGPTEADEIIEADEVNEVQEVQESDEEVHEAVGEEEAAEDDPWTRPGEWFVVHTQSGYEKKVTANLQSRIESMNMEDRIYEVVIPMEEVDEFRNGRKQTVQRKVFPGYLLVRARMDDESWYCIRNTPGVTGFVGQSRPGQKPTPLSRSDVRNFLSAKGDDADRQARRQPRLEFDVGESVRVKEGPFADFSGEIAEINADHLKMKVLVNIFGRETLVEMDFGQVAKL